jgi:hypothetical protein
MAAQAQGLEQLVAFFRVGEEAARSQKSAAVAAPLLTPWVSPVVAERAVRSQGRANGSASADPDFRPF